MKKNLLTLRNGFGLVLLILSIFSFVACKANLFDNSEYGIVNIGFSGEKDARAIGKNALPVIADSNAKIIVFDANGKIIKEENKANLSLKFKVGTKITVKAVISSITAEWTGYKTITIKKGKNTVKLKVNKKAKAFPALTYNSIKQSNGTYTVAINMGSKNLLKISDVPASYISDFKFSAERDLYGNAYIIYPNNFTSTPLSYKLHVYNVEGKEIEGFSDIKVDAYSRIKRDNKTGRVYLFAFDPSVSSVPYKLTVKRTKLNIIRPSFENCGEIELVNHKESYRFIVFNDTLFSVYDSGKACQVMPSTYDSTAGRWKSSSSLMAELRKNLMLKDLYGNEENGKTVIYFLFGDTPAVSLPGGSWLDSVGCIKKLVYNGSSLKVDKKNIGLASGVDSGLTHESLKTRLYI